MKTREELLEEARAAIEQRAEEQWARYAVLAEVAEMVEAGRGIPHATGCNGKACQPDCPLKTRPVAKKHQPTPNVHVPNNQNARESGGKKQQEGETPYTLPANATNKERKEAFLDAIKRALNGKGDSTVTIGKKRYKITKHRMDHIRKHLKQKITPEKIAQVLAYGRFEKEMERGGMVAYYKNTKVILSEDNDGAFTITSAYIESRYRVK